MLWYMKQIHHPEILESFVNFIVFRPSVNMLVTFLPGSSVIKKGLLSSICGDEDNLTNAGSFLSDNPSDSS